MELNIGVRKRNGRVVEFNHTNIYKAVSRALKETEGVDIFDLPDKVVEDVVHELEDRQGDDSVVDIEEIQDLVEFSLMKHSPLVAKKYVLYREKRARLREEGWAMNDLQRDIYEKKYRLANESFGDFVKRVSGGIRSIQKAIIDKKFMPAGRILAGRGVYEATGRKVVLSNCFVLPLEDSVEGIFNTARDMAKTYARGGGVGLNVSPLRPKGSTVHNAAETTSGAVSFMELFSHVTKLIGGSGRRGALMLNMDISHPDIIDFINVKNNLSAVTGANISVNLTDEFLEAVKEDKDYTLKFTDHPRGEQIEKTVKARDIMMMIAKSAWRTGEPGLLFWDRIEQNHLLSHDDSFKLAGVNPCGEQPLPAGGSCNLASINLSEFVDNPFTDKASFNFDEFNLLVVSGVNYLNDIIDENISLLPLDIQKENAKRYREVGLGIMGLADMFIKMGIKYGSEESLKLCDQIGATMANTAIWVSSLMARADGTFPAYNKEAVLKSEFLRNNTTDNVFKFVEENGLRNRQLLTIAPTGSISTLIGVSNGIEPIFRVAYQRKTESLHGEDTYYQVVTEVVKDLMKAKGIKDIKDLPDYVVTADQIPYEERLAVQGMWQKHIDASISSTLNLPNETTVDEVYDILMKSYDYGVKGITIFRDGCEREGILTTGKSKEQELQDLQQKVDEKINEMLLENPNVCPMCGGEMIHSGGCGECQDCGYSPCSI